MPNVAFIHPMVRALQSSYELIADCLAGETQVKFRQTKYLPQPNADDQSEENVARYRAYLTRAVFYNVAQRTQAGMVGQVFLRPPAVEAPAALEPVVTDATGSGVPLDQLAQEATGFAIGFGRCGLYVDYPSVAIEASAEGEGTGEFGATLAQLESGDVRPTMRVISPKDCINWRVIQRGAKLVLSLVVFREDQIISDDGFETKVRDQWRVLRLDEGGQYTIEIYRNRTGTTPDEKYEPRDAAGNRFNDIPFTFIGAMNNDPKPGIMPMYDLCSVNMAHYRNSADYEEAVYMLGQPTPWFGGLTEQWVKEVMGGRVLLGSRAAVLLPANSSAGLLQTLPNTMAKEAMDQKEAQMIALGAKLIEASQTQRTATEANYDNVSETSILSSVAGNVAKAFEFALAWAARFVGAPETGIAYNLNTEFDLVKLTPQERQQLLAEWQGGAITFEEYRDNLRRAGVATMSDAQAKSKIAAEEAERMAAAVDHAGALADATGGDNGPPGAA
jgi:hypothetical protein